MEGIEKMVEEGRKELEKVQKEVENMQDECVKKIREKLLPFSAQSKLRKSGIDIPSLIVRATTRWMDSRKNHITDGAMLPAGVVNWNNDLIQILNSEIDDLIFSDEKGLILLEILVGRKLDLDSAEDGEIISNYVQIFATYIHKRVMEKYTEIHTDMLGKSIMKLKQSSQELSTYMSAQNGSENAQSKKK